MAWINELHYDNASTDVGEFVEVAGPAGTDLTGWTIELYNGSNSAIYDTIALSGVLPDQQAGFGTLAFFFAGIQNGGPDGLALVDDGGSLVEFLSYEGSFTGAGGPADGVTSEDIGVEETTATPIGESLQLTGAGSTAADFTWTGPTGETPGTPNVGQTFLALPDFLAAPATISVTSGGAQTMVLNAGAANAGSFYWILGSLSGTSPGIDLGGGLILPVNVDEYFGITVNQPFNPAFTTFLGLLGPDGTATAALTLPPGSDPGFAGLQLHHAYIAGAVAGVIDYTSTATSLDIVP